MGNAGLKEIGVFLERMRKWNLLCASGARCLGSVYFYDLYIYIYIYGVSHPTPIDPIHGLWKHDRANALNEVGICCIRVGTGRHPRPVSRMGVWVISIGCALQPNTYFSYFLADGASSLPSMGANWNP